MKTHKTQCPKCQALATLVIVKIKQNYGTLHECSSCGSHVTTRELREWKERMSHATQD